MANKQTRSLLELLYRVSREVATALDLRTVLQRVLYAAIDNVGGERGSIIVLDDNDKPLDSIIVYGKRVHGQTTQQLRVTVEHGLAGWVLRNRKAALAPDTSRDERWLRRPDDAIQKSGAKSAICVPLMAREKIVGVMTLVHSLPNAFDRGHLELMQAIADQAGVAVLNARLYTESQRQARVMTALVEGAVAINASLQIEDVLQRILNQVIQALQVETVALALVEFPSEDLVFHAATGRNAGDIIGRRVPAGEGLVGRVAQLGHGMVIPSVGAEKLYTDSDTSSGADVKAVAIAPLQGQGQVIGVMEAINPIDGVFDPDALLVMTGIGGLAGTTIQNAQLFEHLEITHQRYRELFENSTDLILLTDWEGNILEANRMAISISGYQSSQLYETKIDKLHDVDLDKIGLKFEDLDTDTLISYETVLRKRNGDTVPVIAYVDSFYFEDAKLLQWTLRDITERKDLDALRDDLTAMIYHDLRSPLSNVVSSLDVLSNLLGDNKDESVISLMNIATNSTARMQRLISSLLDINRLEAGQPIAEQQKIAPGTLIQDAVDAVMTSINARSQNLKSDLPTDLPEVWVDIDMIHRVLINLLENASKFTPTEGNIEIGANFKKEWVHLWVQDNGPGIAPEDRSRVFDKFTRIKGKETASGLGVGLAFCRLAVDGHGGRIWVDSPNGPGARFHITLPIEKSVQQDN
ncbi:MAG: hypothetical protein B6I38_07160 [Anaerolineaceae bacterium 4572_5.1]|nr:MAG: hypothetical protein B5M51_07645 [Anaerolinea sp. 4484_236]OQY30587.1 MAG: hypothetical protein B6I38_07160 [Anaerolineaceae bacterium 4572_5.1]